MIIKFTWGRIKQNYYTKKIIKTKIIKSGVFNFTEV